MILGSADGRTERSMGKEAKLREAPVFCSSAAAIGLGVQKSKGIQAKFDVWKDLWVKNEVTALIEVRLQGSFDLDIQR